MGNRRQDGYGGVGGGGEKASKEVTQAAEGDQQIVRLFRCCSPISQRRCGGKNKLPAVQCFFTWSTQDKEEERESLKNASGSGNDLKS